MQEHDNPVAMQESFYDLPYHWFPESPLKTFEREEKQRILFSLINRHPSGISEYLDVGCGDGRWTSDIHEFFRTDRMEHVNSHGIDFSERAIGFAKLIKPSIDFEVSRGEDIPFPDRKFDLVTAIEVIEHVADGLEEKFLGELRRVVKEDGLVLITTPSWNLRLAKHHFRHYFPERIEQLASAAGFSIVETRGQSIPYYTRMGRKLRRGMEWVPALWKLWKFTYREASPQKALNLFFALRPKHG